MRASSRSSSGASVASESSCALGCTLPSASSANVSTINGAPACARTSNRSAAVCSGAMGIVCCKRMGPVSRPSSSSMVVLPVAVSPLATAHWMGAAPRYLGSNDACRLMQPRRGRASIHSGTMRPWATTTIASGAMTSSCARNSALLRILSGCATAMPARMAMSLTGGAASCCSRPAGRSGCETTSATSWPADSSASSVGTAKRGVPQKTSFKATTGALPFAFALRLANLAQGEVAFQRAHAKDEQHAVNVVDLMLHAAREQLFAVLLEPFAVLVLGANPHLGGAHDLLANVGEAEAALFLVELALAVNDLRIDENELLRGVLAHAEVDHGEAL